MSSILKNTVSLHFGVFATLAILVLLLGCRNKKDASFSDQAVVQSPYLLAEGVEIYVLDSSIPVTQVGAYILGEEDIYAKFLQFEQRGLQIFWIVMTDPLPELLPDVELRIPLPADATKESLSALQVNNYVHTAAVPLRLTNETVVDKKPSEIFYQPSADGTVELATFKIESKESLIIFYADRPQSVVETTFSDINTLLGLSKTQIQTRGHTTFKLHPETMAANEMISFYNKNLDVFWLNGGIVGDTYSFSPLTAGFFQYGPNEIAISLSLVDGVSPSFANTTLTVKDFPIMEVQSSSFQENKQRSDTSFFQGWVNPYSASILQPSNPDAPVNNLLITGFGHIVNTH